MSELGRTVQRVAVLEDAMRKLQGRFRGAPIFALIAGGAAGAHAVAGIFQATDTLEAVIRLAGVGFAVTDVTDLLTEFTISADATIDNTAGTDTTGSKLLIVWTSTR
jgi:hypothetical protein